MANRYWVGGTANWDNTAGTKWALTSGGAGGQAVPTSSDDVFFDGASGNVVVTITTGANGICKDLNCTGFTGELALSGNSLYSYGNFTLVPGMTFNASNRVYLRGTCSLTTSGKTFNGITIDNASSNVVLMDNVNCEDSVSFSSGILDLNNKDLVCSRFLSTSTSTRTLSLGSGVLEINRYGTTLALSFSINTTNLTFNKGTSTVKFTDNSATNYSFTGGGLTYYNFWNASTGTGILTIINSNTFNDFKIDPGQTVKFTDGTTQTVSSVNIVGTSISIINLTGTSTGGWTISDSSGTNTVSYCNISYSTATGGATWYSLCDTNTDGGNNSGWNFYSPFTNPGNIYSSNNTYTTAPSSSDVLSVEISKDAGVNWSTPLTKTFTASDSLLTFGNGSTELWGLSLTRADMVDANFRVKITSNTAWTQIYKTFGFSTGTDILTGVEIAIEGNYNSPTLSLDLLEVKIYYGTSILPVQVGSQAFASNGRKVGEGAGSGTGTMVYYDGTAWRRVGDDTTIAA